MAFSKVKIFYLIFICITKSSSESTHNLVTAPNSNWGSFETIRPCGISFSYIIWSSIQANRAQCLMVCGLEGMCIAVKTPDGFSTVAECILVSYYEGCPAQSTHWYKKVSLIYKCIHWMII